MFLFIGCLFCAIACIYCLYRFSYLLKKIDDEQLHKVWEADLYEDKKDDTN